MKEEKAIGNGQRWGLDVEAVEDLGKKLEDFCGAYAGQMRTKTRDTSEYGYHYVSGLLRMESKRNMSNIGRTTGQPEQNIQHL